MTNMKYPPGHSVHEEKIGHTVIKTYVLRGEEGAVTFSVDSHDGIYDGCTFAFHAQSPNLEEPECEYTGNKPSVCGVYPGAKEPLAQMPDDVIEAELTASYQIIFLENDE